MVTLSIRVVSDIICPWCYLGNKRLEDALQILEKQWNASSSQKITFHKIWIPYLLNPRIPPDKLISRRQMYLKKFNNSQEKVDKMERNIGILYEKGGLPKYNLDGHVGSTLNAHRLLELARETGHQTELMKCLFRRYHTEGKSPSQFKNLAAAAVEVGMSQSFETIMHFLQSDEKIDQVAAALQSNSHTFPMLSGVPHFRFAIPSKDRINELVHSVIPGAQDPETFVLSLAKFLARAGYQDETKNFVWNNPGNNQQRKETKRSRM